MVAISYFGRTRKPIANSRPGGTTSGRENNRTGQQPDGTTTGQDNSRTGFGRYMDKPNTID